MKKNQEKDAEEEEKKRRMRLRGGGDMPKEEDEEEENWDPESITTCVYLEDGSGRVFVTSTGLYLGFYYLVDFAEERPLQSYPLAPSPCNISKISPSGDLLVHALDTGDINIRLLEKPEKFLNFHMHDASFGKIT